MYVDESEIVIIGDFQSFPSEIYDNSERNNTTRNPLSIHLKLFLQENLLELVDITNGHGPTITYQHKTLPHCSYIDHIAVLKETTLAVSSCQVHNFDPINVSDHQPISFSIEYNPSLQDLIDEVIPKNVIPKYAWLDDDFLNVYKTEVGNKVADISSTHLEIDISCNMLNDILSSSASKAFESCFSGRQKCSYSKEWWTPAVSNAKQLLSAHFKLWKQEGFPKNEYSPTYNRFLMARRNFRQAVKNAQNRVIYKKYTDINGLKNTKPRDFWKNIRQLKKTNIKRSLSINNKQSNEDISNEFADHFNTLLNCLRMKKEGTPKALPNVSAEVFQISTEDVKEAIALLKCSKSPDPFGVVAEHIKYADNDEIYTWLTEPYNSMFNLGTTAQCLSTSIIIPLVKSYKKSLKSFNNYRGICIIPMLTKILEYIILIKCPNIKESHPSQYGFKQNSSTLHAEFLINETLKYYNKKHSAVYMCSLDAEKAFDSCDWSVLFDKLYHDKMIPLPVVKVIASLYEKGTSQVCKL